MALHKGSPIPLYYQLVEHIREQVRTGVLAPGDQLPAERLLSEQYGISRMTVRQAITYLVREGVLITKHGLGTYIAEPKLTQDMLHLLGFTETIMQQGGTVASRVLEQRIVAAPARIATALQISNDAPVVEIVRLRLSDATPLLLETTFVPAVLASGLEHEDLAHQSLYAVLAQRYGLHLRRARQTLEATIANEYEAPLFDIAPGTPMILLEGVTLDEQDRPAEYFKAVYRGDRFTFTFESERGVLMGVPLPHLSAMVA